MRAVVMHEAGTMGLADVPEPLEPGPGQVLVRPEAVGTCGSDYHFLTGELVTPPEFGPQFPRIQGHEVAARIAELGSGCPPELSGRAAGRFVPHVVVRRVLPVHPRPA